MLSLPNCGGETEAHMSYDWKSSFSLLQAGRPCGFGVPPSSQTQMVDPYTPVSCDLMGSQSPSRGDSSEKTSEVHLVGHHGCTNLHGGRVL